MKPWYPFAEEGGLLGRWASQEAYPALKQGLLGLWENGEPRRVALGALMSGDFATAKKLLEDLYQPPPNPGDISRQDADRWVLNLSPSLTSMRQKAVMPLGYAVSKFGKVGAEKALHHEYGAGNIDLENRPVLHNPDNSFSTIESMSFNDGTHEVLIPTIVNGRRMSEDDAIAHYYKTGQHLGKFKSAAEADAYAKRLSEEQGRRYR
jgi:hypothetical protein